jgi:hypothetical protein
MQNLFSYLPRQAAPPPLLDLFICPSPPRRAAPLSRQDNKFIIVIHKLLLNPLWPPFTLPIWLFCSGCKRQIINYFHYKMAADFVAIYCICPELTEISLSDFELVTATKSMTSN